MVAPIWYSIFLAISSGFFVVGIILFLMELFFSGFHFMGQEDASVDTDASLDASLDTDASLDASVDAQIDLAGDTDLGSVDDVGADSDIHIDTGDSSPAPFFLLAAAYCLTTGILGMIFNGQVIGYEIHMLIAVLVPLLVVWVVRKVWKKTASDFINPLPEIKAGSLARTLTEIDDKGGLVLVGSDTPMEHVKKPAKTYGEVIPRDTVVYVLENNYGFLFVSVHNFKKAQEWFGK